MIPIYNHYIEILIQLIVMAELIIIDNIMTEGNYGNGHEELCGLW